MNDISVYGIWHRFTQMVYIGHSVTTERRFAVHRNALRRGDHHCGHLQNAWTKDGEASFEFRRLVVCTNKAEAVEIEQDYFNAFFEKGYLYNSVGSNDPQVFMLTAHSQAAREKNTASKNSSPAFRAACMANLSKAWAPEAVKRRVESAQQSGRLGESQRQPVLATRIRDGQVFRFASRQEAARALGTSHGNIYMCLQGKRSQARGFHFKDAA